jgi:hypothetical protein
MTQIGKLQYCLLAYFSRPAADRAIYRAIRKRPVRNIIEFGVGNARRTERMITLAASARPHQPIEYTGIDLFEARPADEPQIPLKRAFMLLRKLNAQVKLSPGDPFTALARIAHSIADADLVVVAADQDASAMRRAWSYVPRIIHDETLVFVEQPSRTGRSSRFVQLDHAAVSALAGGSGAPALRRAA